MSTDDGLEYGPTPTGAQYEHTDIDPSIGYTFALWLVVAMMVSAGILYGAFWYFSTSELARDTRVQQFPLAAGQVKVRPAPLLQTQPFKDVYLLKQGQNERLDSVRLGRQSGRDRPHPDRPGHRVGARARSAGPGGWVGCDQRGGAGQFRRPNGGPEIEAPS